MILCHPHNPTGHVFTRPELERIAEIAARHDLVVVSDEIHADLVHAPHGHVPFESLDPDVAARTITVTSASKAFNLAGLRWAIMHAGMRRDAIRARRVARPLPRRAERDGGRSDRDRVDGRRRVGSTRSAWCSTRTVTPSPACSPRTSRTCGTRLPTRRISPGSTAGCSASATTPRVTFRERGVELSPGPQFGVEGTGFVRLNFADQPGDPRRDRRRDRRQPLETPPFCLLQISPRRSFDADSSGSLGCVVSQSWVIVPTRTRSPDDAWSLSAASPVTVRVGKTTGETPAHSTTSAPSLNVPIGTSVPSSLRSQAW